MSRGREMRGRNARAACYFSGFPQKKSRFFNALTPKRFACETPLPHASVTKPKTGLIIRGEKETDHG